MKAPEQITAKRKHMSPLQIFNYHNLSLSSQGILVFLLCKYLMAQDNPIYVVRRKENIVHSEYDLLY